ncbi:MAG TPA: hypothetical protein VHE54_07330 [Puia sp.]|nr:hypothetical protein [Puia sp.]
MKRLWIRRAPFFIVLALLGILVFVELVMLLWNALMPDLFHLPVITFWQALGLLVLSKILFGGFRGGGARPWRNKARQRWMDMTPEERERFKAEWGRRCRGYYGTDDRRSQPPYPDADAGGESAVK